MKNIINEVKFFSLIFLLSLILFIILSPLRGGYITINNLFSGPDLSLIFGFIFYYIFTIYNLNFFQKKLSTIKILLAILLGKSILDIPLRIFDFNSALISLPDSLFQIISILLGYLAFFLKQKWKIIIFILGISMSFVMAFKGLDFWYNKLNFGTFIGRFEDCVIYELKLQNKSGDIVQRSAFSGKYLILDCWYTYCGVCYKEFPNVQKVYDEYKDNSIVDMYAVHSRIEADKEDAATGANILEKEGYTFPCLSIDIENPVLKDLGVKVYPTVLIFDPENRLVFRGSILDAEKFLSNNLNQDT